jgi:hypothetical protein
MLVLSVLSVPALAPMAAQQAATKPAEKEWRWSHGLQSRQDSR